MSKLTKRQIGRQDFVDNEIFEMINRLPPAGKKMEWDIEVIAAVREAIRMGVILRKKIGEMRFYPYVRM